MLVALLIMAVLSTMAWQGIDGIVRSRDAAQARMDQALRLNVVIGQVQADLQAVHDTGAVVPALAFDGATLRLVRRADNGLQLVAWSLRGDALMRWAGTVATRAADLQDQWMRSQQLLGNETGQVRALAGVSAWQLYCFRGAWSNCQSSADVTPANPGAPGQQRDVLPTAVRVVLTLREGNLTRELMLAPQE